MGKLPAASARYQTQATSSSESLTDRFSDLPDDIAHLILSPLPFKDLTRVSSVSKRCRQLHLSVPVVDFATYWSEVMTVEKKSLQRFCMDWHFYPSKTIEQLSDDNLRVTVEYLDCKGSKKMY
ncbi:hypothetical protein L3X38_034866 [Prunus dulcis]|uniref:F-box domain-containing protein n=1 Tax=Prunus dulcis TaxID=3755 RepID=A0AAD4YXA0_PRUDU|nr:hypothetical protein L3X38_034866 [Prunus dulcis]